MLWEVEKIEKKWKNKAVKSQIIIFHNKRLYVSADMNVWVCERDHLLITSKMLVISWVVTTGKLLISR